MSVAHSGIAGSGPAGDIDEYHLSVFCIVR
jgi:hypothetical protein